MTFQQLHQQDKSLLIGNVWDVASANIAEKLGFQALGTSSAAIAKAQGYEDGEQMSFEALLYVVKRICQNSSLPVTVDIESGYGESSNVVLDNIMQLASLGVVGINIEDSQVNQERSLINADTFAALITDIRTGLAQAGVSMFINVRTDTFILDHPNVLDETFKRMDLYTAAGADGIFIPCIEKESDIKQVLSKTSLPLNVMCMPNLPDFDTLNQWGVKRISMGNFVYEYMNTKLESTLKLILDKHSFSSIFIE